MLVLVVLCNGRAALAAPGDAPDVEVARRRYRIGVDAYASGDYTTALAHFEIVRTVLPSPEIEYDIARCLDRLERWREAADAYERFARSRASATAKLEAAERAQVLRGRVLVLERVRPDGARMRLGAGLTLGATVLLGASAAAVYGATYATYAAKRDACAGGCAPGSYDGLRDEVRTGQIATGVLFGLAGLGLGVDVALWVLARRPSSPAVEVSTRGMRLRF